MRAARPACPFTGARITGMEFLQPDLSHRDTEEFKRALEAVTFAEDVIDRPENCPPEAIASVSLVASALDIVDNKQVSARPMEVALQEEGAWQAMLPLLTFGQWWRVADRMTDPYAASMAAAAAIFNTPEEVPTARVHKRLNRVQRATPMVRHLDGALTTLRMREHNTLNIARIASTSSAKRMREMYIHAVAEFTAAEKKKPQPEKTAAISASARALQGLF